MPAEHSGSPGSWALGAVLPTSEFAEAALAWADRIAGQPRAALFAAKRAVVEGLGLALADGLKVESAQFAERLRSEEARTLMRAVPGARLGPRPLDS